MRSTRALAACLFCMAFADTLHGQATVAAGSGLSRWLGPPVPRTRFAVHALHALGAVVWRGDNRTRRVHRAVHRRGANRHFRELGTRNYRLVGSGGRHRAHYMAGRNSDIGTLRIGAGALATIPPQTGNRCDSQRSGSGRRLPSLSGHERNRAIRRGTCVSICRRFSPSSATRGRG